MFQIESILNIILLGATILIIFEDFKSRLVSIWPAIIIFAALLVKGVIFMGGLAWIGNFALNLGVLSIMIGVIAIYIRLRFGSFNAFGKDAFGLGDVLYLACFAAAFTLPSFVVFVLVSSFLGIFGYIIFQTRWKKNGIPLVSFMGLSFIAWMLLTTIGYFPHQLSNDFWIQTLATL